jgi:hypothetical protein
MAKVAPQPISRAHDLGLRVRNRLDGRSGLIVGRPEHFGTRCRLYPVTIESSTRTELWADHWIDVRPLREQPIALGGRYKAPPGYPLNS